MQLSEVSPLHNSAGEPVTDLWSDYEIRMKRLHLHLAQALIEFELVTTEQELRALFKGSPVPEDYFTLNHKPRDEALEEFSQALQVSKNIDDHPFLNLSEALQLTEIEEDFLFAILAPYLDSMNGSIYGTLLQRDTAVQPNMETLAMLYAPTVQQRAAIREVFDPARSFSHYLFPELEADDDPWYQPLTLDSGMIKRLLGNASTGQLSRSIRYISIEEEPHALFIQEEIQERLLQMGEQLMEEDEEAASTTFIHLQGTPGCGRTFQVHHFASAYEMDLFILDTDFLDSTQEFERQVKKLFREALLSASIIMIRNLDHMFQKDSSYLSSDVRSTLNQELKYYQGLVFFSSSGNWRDAFDDVRKLTISVKNPNEQERKKLWLKFAEWYDFAPDVNWDMIAGAFRLPTGAINAVVRQAKEQRLLLAKEADATLLHEACYEQVEHKLAEKGDKLQVKGTWDDLVLPKAQKAQLRQACNQMTYRTKVFGEWGFSDKLSYGKGLSMLFSGPPGTGKTMGAEVVAHELGLHIYKIDLSRVVSKYIGETEKSLQSIFDEAEKSHAILFFDEMDALFGKRSEVKDAKDKYANIEVSFLLQKMEQYEGITILATNLLQNIDEAFLRRIQYIIHFPFPKKEEREKMWQNVFPKKLPVDDDVDAREIAEKLEVAGGNIKNIAVSAAFLAAADENHVTMQHIVKAALQEARKTGKVINTDDWIEFLTEEEDAHGQVDGHR